MANLQTIAKTPFDLIKKENNTPSLAYIIHKIGSKKLAENLVKYYLINLNDYFNLTRPMKESQIDDTVNLIIDAFPTLKILDIIYTFKQAKLGRFGKMFESLDGMKILSWIEQVMQERMEAGEALSIAEHEQNKRNLETVVGNERSTEAKVSEIIKNINAHEK